MKMYQWYVQHSTNCLSKEFVVGGGGTTAVAAAGGGACGFLSTVNRQSVKRTKHDYSAKAIKSSSTSDCQRMLCFCVFPQFCRPESRVLSLQEFLFAKKHHLLLHS